LHFRHLQRGVDDLAQTQITVKVHHDKVENGRHAHVGGVLGLSQREHDHQSNAEHKEIAQQIPTVLVGKRRAVIQGQYSN
jgi:hypothetical protein